jgi:hypothetical protein
VGTSNIRASLDDLIRQRDQIDEKLVEMNRLLRERDAIERAIVGLEEVLKLEYGGPSEQLPLWQGARQILFENDGPMTARQVAEALLAMGWKLEGKTPIESGRTTLIRKPETFERLADGRFSLRPTSSIGALMSDVSTNASRLGAILTAAKGAYPSADPAQPRASSAVGRDPDAED